MRRRWRWPRGCTAARATIVMPQDAPALKLAATRGYGAEVIVYDRYKQDRAEIAARLTKERGASLIPPYDHLPVMAGQGTAALELIEDAGALDALIVCAGGGGFLSGCAVAAKHLLPGIEVFGAEPERGNDMQQSLRSGQIVHIDVPRTICDGQQTQSPGKHPFEVIQALVTDVLTVPDPVVVRGDALRVRTDEAGAGTLGRLCAGGADASPRTLPRPARRCHAVRRQHRHRPFRGAGDRRRAGRLRFSRRSLPARWPR